MDPKLKLMIKKFASRSGAVPLFTALFEALEGAEHTLTLHAQALERIENEQRRQHTALLSHAAGIERLEVPPGLGSEGFVRRHGRSVQEAQRRTELAAYLDDLAQEDTGHGEFVDEKLAEAAKLLRQG